MTPRLVVSAAPLVGGGTEPPAPLDLLLPGSLILGALLIGGTAFTVRRAGTRRPSVSAGGQSLRTDFAQGDPIVHIRTVDAAGAVPPPADLDADGLPEIHVDQGAGDDALAQHGRFSVDFDAAEVATPSGDPDQDATRYIQGGGGAFLTSSRSDAPGMKIAENESPRPTDR